MAVFHKQDSLKQLHEEQEQKKTQTDEISELQDALIEIAGIIEGLATATANKEGGDNG